MKNCSKLLSTRLSKQAQKKKSICSKNDYVFTPLSRADWGVGGCPFLLSYRKPNPRPDSVGFIEEGQDQ